MKIGNYEINSGNYEPRSQWKPKYIQAYDNDEL